MDTLEGIEQLVACAREEITPAPDVSARVLKLIASGRRFQNIGLSLYAAASVVAASVAVFLAVNCWISLNDPMMELFAPLQGAAELPW